MLKYSQRKRGRGVEDDRGKTKTNKEKERIKRQQFSQESGE